jgi:DNA-binding transcriptional ArsR family regulator
MLCSTVLELASHRADLNESEVEVPEQKLDGPADLTTVLALLSHQLRRDIVRLLLDHNEPLAPVEASRILRAPLSTLSYHFDRLAAGGAILLRREEEVPQGLTKHFYVPAPGFLDDALARALLEVEP